MKIYIHSEFGSIDDQVMLALQKLTEDQSKRRSYFHPLKGFNNLSALSIPGSAFKGRIILKHHGNDEYELVLIDHDHQYNVDTLRSLDKLAKRESLKELFVTSGNEAALATSEVNADIPAYNLRGKIIIPTDEQWALSEHIDSFVEGQLEPSKHILVEGVPGAGKTLTIEVAIENFIRSGIKHDGVRKTLFYVAPSCTNLLDKMKSHILSLPNGQEFLDRGLIELHEYDILVKRLSNIPAKAYSEIKMMFLLDEVQAAKIDHFRTAFSCGHIVGFGDMNQAIQAGKHFADLAAEAADKDDQITLQTLSESLRCPIEVMEFAKLFLSERNKQAKQSGAKQRSYVVPAERKVEQHGEHVKFYVDKFLDSLSPVSTQIAYVTFNQEQKAKLVAQGKINVFDAKEIAGLEFDHVVISLDARELSRVLSNPQDYNLLYMVSTRSLKTLYLDRSLITILPSIAERYQPKASIEKIELKKESSIDELKEQAVRYLIDGHASQASQIVNLIRRRNGLPNSDFDITATYFEVQDVVKVNIVDHNAKLYAAICTIELALGKSEIYADAYAYQIIFGNSSQYSEEYAKIYEQQIKELQSPEYAKEYTTAYMTEIKKGESKEYASAYAAKIALGMPSYVATDYAVYFEQFYKELRKAGKKEHEAIKYAAVKADEKVKNFSDNYLKMINEGQNAEYATYYAGLYVRQKDLGKDDSYAENYARLCVRLELTENKDAEYAVRRAIIYADQRQLGKDIRFAEEYAYAYVTAIDLKYSIKDAEIYAKAYTAQKILGNKSHDYSLTYAEQIAKYKKPPAKATEIADKHEQNRQQEQNHDYKVEHKAQAVTPKKNADGYEQYTQIFTQQLNLGKTDKYASAYAAQILTYKESPECAAAFAEEYEKQLGLHKSHNYAFAYARHKVKFKESHKNAAEFAILYEKQRILNKTHDYAFTYAEQIVKLKKNPKEAAEFAKIFDDQIQKGKNDKYALEYAEQIVTLGKSPEYATIYAEQVVKYKQTPEYAKEYAYAYVAAIDLKYSSKDAETFAYEYTTQKIIGKKNHDYSTLYACQIARDKQTPAIAREFAEIYVQQKELRQNDEYATIYAVHKVRFNRSNDDAEAFAALYEEKRRSGECPEYAHLYADQILTMKRSIRHAGAFTVIYEALMESKQSHDFAYAYATAKVLYEDSHEDALEHAKEVERSKKKGSQYTAEYIAIYDEQRELKKTDIYASVYVEQILDFKVDPKTAAEFAEKFEQHKPPKTPAEFSKQSEHRQLQEKTEVNTSSHPVGVSSAELKGEKRSTEDDEGQRSVAKARCDSPSSSDGHSFVERLAEQRSQKSNRSLE